MHRSNAIAIASDPMDTAPTSWADAVRIETQLQSLLCLAVLRSGGKTWAELSYFLAELKKLVGPSARNPSLRGANITSLVTNIISQSLEL